MARSDLSEEIGAVAKLQQAAEELAVTYRSMFDTANSGHIGAVCTSAVAMLESVAAGLAGAVTALDHQLAYMVGQSATKPCVRKPAVATGTPPRPAPRLEDLLRGAATDALLREDAARNRLFRSIGFETSYTAEDGFGLLHLAVLPHTGLHPQGFDPNFDDFFVRSLDRHGRVVGQPFAFGPPRHQFDYPAEGIRRAASVLNLSPAQLVKRVRGAMATTAGKYATGTAQIMAAGWAATHHGPVGFVVAVVAGQIVAFIIRLGTAAVSRWLIGHGDPLSMGLHAFCPAPPEDGSIEVIRLPTRREAVTSALDALTAERRRSGDTAPLRAAEAELGDLRILAEKWDQRVNAPEWRASSPEPAMPGRPPPGTRSAACSWRAPMWF